MSFTNKKTDFIWMRPAVWRKYDFHNNSVYTGPRCPTSSYTNHLTFSEIPHLMRRLAYATFATGLKTRREPVSSFQTVFFAFFYFACSPLICRYTLISFVRRCTCRYQRFRCTCERTANRANVTIAVNVSPGRGCCKGTSARTRVSRTHDGRSLHNVFPLQE